MSKIIEGQVVSGDRELFVPAPVIPDEPDLPAGADFQVYLAGRWVAFRDLKSGQRIMIQRMFDRIPQLDDDAEVTDEYVRLSNLAISAVFDAYEPTILSDDDRTHVTRCMLRGELDIPDALRILRRGKDAKPVDDDAAPPEPARALRKKPSGASKTAKKAL